MVSIKIMQFTAIIHTNWGRRPRQDDGQFSWFTAKANADAIECNSIHRIHSPFLITVRIRRTLQSFLLFVRWWLLAPRCCFHSFRGIFFAIIIVFSVSSIAAARSSGGAQILNWLSQLFSRLFLHFFMPIKRCRRLLMIVQIVGRLQFDEVCNEFWCDVVSIGSIESGSAAGLGGRRRRRVVEVDTVTTGTWKFKFRLLAAPNGIVFLRLIWFLQSQNVLTGYF